jgi:hypothetical protein
VKELYDTRTSIKIISIVISVALTLFEVSPIFNSSSARATYAAILHSHLITMTKTMKQIRSHHSAALYGLRDSDKHIILPVLSFYTTNSFNDVAGNNNDIDSTRVVSRSHSSSKNNKRFVHSSIRIEEDVLKALQIEAQRREVSFNNFVNKTLKNYITSEMYFEQLGFILVSKEFLRITFLKIDEKYAEEFGREIGLTVAREYMSYFSGQVNNDTLIEFLNIWFRRFQFSKHRVENLVGNDITVNGKEQKQRQKQQLHLFTVIHDINMNFSIVLKAILEGLIEPIIKSPIVFRDITPTFITFSFRV